MHSKCTSNDLDLVKPTQYNVQPNYIAKTRPPKPWPLPDFNPFYINNFEGHGQPNLLNAQVKASVITEYQVVY